MSSTYFYARDGVESGPVEAARLKQLARDGHLSPNDRVRRSDSTRWVQASTVGGLFPSESLTPPPLPPGATAYPAPPASAPDSSTGSAGPAVSTFPPPPTSYPESAPADPTPESASSKAGRIALAWLKVAGIESFRIARATAAQALRLVGIGRGAWQQRQRQQALQDAKVKLGRRMVETGVGDPALRARAQQLNESIVSIQAAKGSTKHDEQERTGLFIRLAESIPGPNAPASVSQEFAAVAHSQSALLGGKEQQGQARARLLPPPGPERWRVAAGCGICLLALMFVAYPLFVDGNSSVVVDDDNGPGPGPTPDRQPLEGPSAEELVERARAAGEPSAAERDEATDLIDEGNDEIAAADSAAADGDLEESSERRRAAIRHYDRAIEAAPGLVDAYLQRGQTHYFLLEYEAAIRDLTVVTELDPRMPDGWTWRAATYADMSEHDKAISDADQAIRLKYEQPIAHFARGTALMNQGNHEEALRSLSDAINLNNGIAVFFTNRSNVQLNLGDNAACYDDASMAIQLDPGDAMAYNNRAASLLNFERYDDAIADLDRALQLLPGDPLLHANRALARWGLGDARRAVRDAEAAVAGNPESGRNYVIRAAAYEISDRLDEAMADIETAVAMNSLDIYLLLTRGNIHFKRGEYQQALVDYDQLVQMEPGWYRAYQARGEAHNALGNTALANADFDMARSLQGR